VSREDVQLAQLQAIIAELTSRIGALEAGRAADAGRRIGEQRARNAQNMSPEVWNRIYGQPSPTSRVVGELQAQNIRGRVYGPVPDGPEVHYGEDDRAWR
jgi:hypothetical protein